DRTGQLAQWLTKASDVPQRGQKDSIRARAVRRWEAYLGGAKLQAQHERVRGELAARQVNQARQRLRGDRDFSTCYPDEKWIERVDENPQARAQVTAQLLRRFDPQEEYLEEAVVQVEKVIGGLIDDGLKQLQDQLRALDRAPAAHTRPGMHEELLA